MPPTVSVAIPAWNAAPWLRRAVESALAQTCAPLEVVVVDDGSTDDTPRVLESLGDRVRWIRTENRGANPSRNLLLEETRGEWVQFLDADDRLDPDKIEGQVRLAVEEGASVVAAPARQEGTDRVLHGSRYDDPWSDLAETRLGVTSANLWSRRAVVEAGAWDPGWPVCQEYDLVLRLLARGERFALDRRVRTTWGWNPDSVSRGDPGAMHHAFARIQERAMRILLERGEFTDARREVYGHALLWRTWEMWKVRHPGWREAEAWTREARPRPWEWADPAWRVFGPVYRLLGYAGARRYDRAAAVLRRALGMGRRG